MAYRLYTVLALVILIGRSSAAEASGADNDTETACFDTLVAMGAAIGALVLLEVVTVIGWLCTVVMQWNRLKPTNRR